jgi:hypothetical protein
MTDSDQPDDGETKSQQTRHPYTNDVLALVVVTGFYAIVGYGVHAGVYQPGALVLDTALFLAVASASVWLFGRGGLAALRELRK